MICPSCIPKDRAGMYYECQHLHPFCPPAAPKPTNILRSLHKAIAISDLDPAADPVQNPWSGAF